MKAVVSIRLMMSLLFMDIKVSKRKRNIFAMEQKGTDGGIGYCTSITPEHEQTYPTIIPESYERAFWRKVRQR